MVTVQTANTPKPHLQEHILTLTLIKTFLTDVFHFIQLYSTKCYTMQRSATNSFSISSFAWCYSMSFTLTQVLTNEQAIVPFLCPSMCLITCVLIKTHLKPAALKATEFLFGSF